jgi:ElaA protein
MVAVGCHSEPVEGSFQMFIFETMEKIIWHSKHFKDLTAEELYRIFHLRLSVFVVEQNCPYQDADGKDLKSFHFWGSLTPNPSPKEGGKLIAYARILPPGISYKEASIGRVVTSTEARKIGAGKILMQKSMEFIKKEFGDIPVRIGAQAYLQKFYEGFGFVREGDEYDEDGIPHIIMLYTPR